MRRSKGTSVVSQVRTGNRPQCRHCHQRLWPYSRGLCEPCFHTPEVLALYPITPRPQVGSGSRGYGLWGFRNRLPLAEPTTVPPGEGKVPVLAARAAAGVELWHPQDATWDDNSWTGLTG